MEPSTTLQPTHHANSVYAMRTKKDLAQYLHQACWSPVTRTWTDAINEGYLATFPGLTASLVTKHLPPSLATAKGHMRNTRQHIRSTTKDLTQPTEMTAPVPTTMDSARANMVVLKSLDLPCPTGKVATDQTGRFPVRSSRGYQYIMVAYVHDSNSIHAVPLRNRAERSLIDAYADLYQQLTSKGLQPRLQISDNECSAAFRRFLQQYQIKLQLVPPYDHRTNPAKRAIESFKSHFIAGLASLPPDFPLHLWDRLLPHATTTLNLLRPSRLNPKLSAHQHLHGTFDFNRTPLAPPGCRCVVYEHPGHRRTWSSRGTDAWYLGPATDHYRCHRLYVPSTRSERIAKRVDFFPHNCSAPFATPQDNATHAAESLAKALKGAMADTPFDAPGDAQLKAIHELSDIFSDMTANNKSNITHTQKPSTITQLPRVPVDHASLPRVLIKKTMQPSPVSTPPLTYNVPTPKSQPHLIPPDDDQQPSTHRYNLRSHANAVHSFSPHYANAVINEDTGVPEEFPALARGPNSHIWKRAYANDLDRLAQGKLGRVKGTNTVFFITKDKVPAGRKVTYGRKQCTLRPTKEEVHRVRLTIGGDRLDYPGDASSQCASIITTKILLNSVISTPGARFGTADITAFYYGTPMERFEYMKIRYDEIPREIVDAYDLDTLAHDGYVYMEIQKGMPGLKQAGRIANDRLITHLAKYGYAPVRHTSSLWRHHTRPIAFTLVVDDFGIKYEGNQHFDHLISAISDLYDVTVDKTGSKYLGMTIEWDYDAGTCLISMPKYIETALHKFQHNRPRKRQDAPHAWQKPTYGSKVQYANDDDDSPNLPATAKKRIQEIVGTFTILRRCPRLHHARRHWFLSRTSQQPD